MSAQDREFAGILRANMTVMFDNVSDLAREFVGQNFTPEEVFDEAVLEAWAAGQGYMKMTIGDDEED